MMRQRIFLVSLLMCLGLLTVIHPAKADTVDDITFSLTPANLSGTPGSVLTWTYTLTDGNTDPLVAFVLTTAVNSTGFDPTTGTPDASVFTPLFLTGGSGTGTLFAFDSDPAVPNSFNTGSFILTVGLLDGNFDTLNEINLTESYTATIGTVPEPGALTFLALGLACCLAISRKLS